jgi:nucleoside 2-deoxyribosyltransferase
MTTTYLCGGINGLEDSACKDWRETAKRLLVTKTLDPMARDYRGVEDQNVREIVENDVLDIESSDFLLVNVSRPSWGTAMEIVYAHRSGKPCFGFVEGPNQRISPWLRYHCVSVSDSMGQAIHLINSMARGVHREQEERSQLPAGSQC